MATGFHDLVVGMGCGSSGFGWRGARPQRGRGRAALCPTNPTPRPVFTSGEAYADWINQRIGKKVTQLREGLGMTPYALGLKCGVTDQTILNIEHGTCKRGHLTGTLARIAFFFGITLEALIESAAA